MQEIIKSEHNKLGEGVSILYEMEQNNYLMTRAMQQLDQQISRLGHPFTPKKPEYPAPRTFFIEILMCSVPLGGLIGGIVGVASFLASDNNGILYKIFFSVLSFLLSAAIGAVIGCAVAAVSALVIYMIKMKKANEKYQEMLREYQQKVANARARTQRELAQKKVLLEQREKLTLRLTQAKGILESFYDTMRIHVEYRSLMAVGYMDKFIRLGISNKLTGADGLYYLIMQELDKQVLQLTLFEIASKLDSLIDNQNRLYSEIYDLNHKCDKLIAATTHQVTVLNNIQSNTALTAYHADRINRELEFQNFMLLYGSL